MKPFFHRNRPDHSPELKKNKKFRYSVDIPNSSRPKLSQEHKKVSKKEVPGYNDRAKKQNSCVLKSKPTSSVTTKTSLNATKSNSPFKSSLVCSSGILTPVSSIKDYKFYYQIGLGAFGKVWKVQERATDKQYALKELSKSKVIEKGNLISVINERKILSRLNNPFLVNMHRSFQDQNKLYLVIDYLKGADMRYHICYHQHFTQDQIKFIAACTLLALEYIHNKKIIHKDIKPQNIIFQQNGYLRLTDFGIAIQKKTQQCAPVQSSGTPVYMAPEILFKRNYSYQSDFYSLGIVIFQLVMGRRPYSGKTRNQIRDELSNKEICLADYQIPQCYSPHLADLINKLLKKNPNERLGKNGVDQIKEHPFFNSIKWKKLERKEVKPPYIPNVVCQTQAYLSQINLFNEMNQNNELPSQSQHQYEYVMQYDFQKLEENVKKGRGMKKMRRSSMCKMVA